MDIIDLLVQKLKEQNPRAETRAGSAQRDLLIVPLSKLLEPYDEQQADIQAGQRLGNYATLTEEQMDALAGNLFVFRDAGVKARSAILIGFAQATDVELQAGDIVQDAEGNKTYELEADYNLTAGALSENLGTDGLFYTDTIPVVATQPGDEYTVAADELIDMPLAPPGAVRITNPLASQYGAHKETNAELYQRLPTALSTRQILNTPGTRGQLLEQFRHIREIYLVGHGHALMARDETFEYSRSGGRVLPVASFYGKLKRDTENNNKAWELSSPTAIPAIADFSEELSQQDYTRLARPNDAEVAQLDTNLLLDEDFTRSGEFHPVETDLTVDAEGTATLHVENPALFEPGDYCRIIDDNTDPVYRTLLELTETTMTFTEGVDNAYQVGQNARVERVLREEAVENEWFESEHGEALGTELDGPEATVDSGKLVLGKASYATDSTLHSVTDAQLEEDLEELFKQILQAAGYNPDDTQDVKDQVEGLTYKVSTTTTSDTSADDPTVNVSDTTGFDSAGTAYLDGNKFTYTGTTSTTFTGCTGVVATTYPVDVDQGLVPAVKANQIVSVSPVVQRFLDQHNGLRITARISTTDDSTNGRFGYFLVRKSKSDDASYYYGFGIAWRRAVADTGVSTTLSNDTADDDVTVTVASTAAFPASGVAILEDTPFSYTGKTSTTFTGCVGVVEKTAPVDVYKAKPSLYVVDNGNLPGNENAYLAAAQALLLADTDYYLEILLTPPTVGDTVDAASATEVRIWKDGDDRPTQPSLSYGTYIPTSARNEYADDVHFGISVYDCDGDQWYVDDLQIESIAPNYPHHLYRLDATDFADPFKVRALGRAWGENTSEEQAYGLTLRLWNNTTSAWEIVGNHTQTTVAEILSASGYRASTYSTPEGYIYLMASGDYAWGLDYAAVLEMDYVTIYDDGIEGVHIGSKVDVYVKSYDQLQTSYGDLSSVASVEYLNTANGFTPPVASIDAVFLLDVEGNPVGTPLTEGTDYAMTELRPELRYSAVEHNALTFSASRVGANVRVYYSYFQYIGDIQDYLDADNRLTAADVLAKAFIPAYIDVTIEAGGFGISDTEMERSIREWIEGLSREFEIADLITEVQTLGATRVNTPLTAYLEMHPASGQKTEVEVTDDYTVDENVRYIPREVVVVRI